MNKHKYLLVILVLFFFACSSNYKWTEKTTESLFGKSIFLNKTFAKYYSNSMFTISLNGDGYFIDVFHLPENYIEYIIINFDEIKLSYPHFDLDDDWKAVYWQKTPIKEDEKHIYDRIIGNENYFFYESRSFQKAIKYYKKIMNDEGNFYSYEYKFTNTNSIDIEFYVFSPKEKILIIISYHT